jgi:TRAP-type C4-dicarboxylate transport system permease small subunit
VRLLSVLKWIDKNLEEAVMAVLLFIMVLSSGAQVFMRYVVRSSLSWSEELTRYLFVWTGFMAIGYCYRRWSSLKIDALVSILPKKARMALDILVNISTIVLFVFVLIASRRIMLSRATQMQVSPAMQIPMSWLYAAPVVGFAIAIIRVVQCVIVQLRELLCGPKDDKKGEAACQ